MCVGSLQSLDWNEWTGMVDWNGGTRQMMFCACVCTKQHDDWGGAVNFVYNVVCVHVHVY